ncbi:MAG: hypothetical protein SVP26_09310 [Chloroflexota bacterium]|nr:hypothetical protein [Chloroflexota bacterium]
MNGTAAIPSSMSIASGRIALSTPIAAASPLPPLKRRKTGQLCPIITAKLAMKKIG